MVVVIVVVVVVPTSVGSGQHSPSKGLRKHPLPRNVAMGETLKLAYEDHAAGFGGAPYTSEEGASTDRGLDRAGRSW